MATLIALIRGINVGTAKRVPMKDLREKLSDLGYDDVRTLLQSGNAIFATDDAPTTAAGRIEQLLVEEFGVPARVLVRTRKQVLAAVAADPLTDIATDGSKHFLGFLESKPSKKMLAEIDELADDERTSPDLARVIDDHVYLWCPNGISNATFAKANWDRKLGTAVTMRNWNTVTKLIKLSED
jgi:uncharacterized protein (DUF1697 family)